VVLDSLAIPDDKLANLKEKVIITLMQILQWIWDHSVTVSDECLSVFSQSQAKFQISEGIFPS
jgi:hypothetical protein